MLLLQLLLLWQLAWHSSSGFGITNARRRIRRSNAEPVFAHTEEKKKRVPAVDDCQTPLDALPTDWFNKTCMSRAAFGPHAQLHTLHTPAGEAWVRTPSSILNKWANNIVVLDIILAQAQARSADYSLSSTGRWRL